MKYLISGYVGASAASHPSPLFCMQAHGAESSWTSLKDDALRFPSANEALRFMLEHGISGKNYRVVSLDGKTLELTEEDKAAAIATILSQVRKASQQLWVIEDSLRSIHAEQQADALCELLNRIREISADTEQTF